MPSSHVRWLILFVGAVFGVLVWAALFSADPLPWWGAFLILTPFAVLLYALGVRGTVTAAAERGLDEGLWTWLGALMGPASVFVILLARPKKLSDTRSSVSS